jgi:ABC-2 type transport system ATP-binding protein/lipopolysaccharide transport system ATP-binding protein
MLGLNFAQASALVDEVAEFSELGDFLRLPTRTYSSGMQLRLAFAVTTAVHHEILIMDELIGAGDRAFMDKAERRIQDLVNAASIFVIATHDENILKRFCTQAIFLEKGGITYMGEIESALEAYRDSLVSA